MVPFFMPGTVPRTKWRSVPQMALAVRRTIASVSFSSFGSRTSSSRMSPTPWKTIAFIPTSVPAPSPGRRAAVGGCAAPGVAATEGVRIAPLLERLGPRLDVAGVDPLVAEALLLLPAPDPRLPGSAVRHVAAGELAADE